MTSNSKKWLRTCNPNNLLSTTTKIKRSFFRLNWSNPSRDLGKNYRSFLTNLRMINLIICREKLKLSDRERMNGCST